MKSCFRLSAAVALTFAVGISPSQTPSAQPSIEWFLRVPMGADENGGLTSARSGKQAVERIGVQRASGLAVFNGASFGGAISPGSWIVIRGLDLAGVTRSWTAADFSGDRLPTALSGTSVRIGNRDAAVLFISPTQINALIPPDVPEGATTLTVTSPVGPAASLNVRLEAFAPGLFMFGPENGRYVAAVLPDGTFAGKQGLFPGSPTLTRPVRAGQNLSLFATGLGPTGPEIPAGLNFSDARPMHGREHFHVTVGGQEARVDFVGAVSPGLYQINIAVPGLRSGEYPVAISFGDFRSPAGPLLTVQGDPASSRLQPSPAALSLTAFTTATTPATQALQLLSSGEDFDFTLATSAPWLTVDLRSGRTPATLRVSADGRAVSAGTYNERITVSAPGTATPTQTIPVTVTVSSAPQISLSRTELNYQLLNDFSSLAALVNVVSGAGNVNFTATASDPWISVAANGTTPAALRVTLLANSRPVGTYSGKVVVTPAGGAPREINVTMRLVAAPAVLTGVAPQLLWMDEDDLLLGRNGSMTLRGINLTGTSSVRVTPPDGITIRNAQSTNASTVTLEMEVSANAPEGPRTLIVTAAAGATNALPFTLRRGEPQIRGLSPVVVQPGRFYATAGFAGSPRPSEQFQLQGVDLGNIRNIVIEPADGAEALWSIPVNNATSVSGVMELTPAAAVGPRRLRIETATGRSNELTFDVQAVPRQAPVIRNCVASAFLTRGNVNYTGSFDFEDPDGDLREGARLFLMPDSGSGGNWQFLVVDRGTYLNQEGKTSGKITFAFQLGFGFLYREATGRFPIRCMLQDAAGNLSNVDRSPMVTSWQVPVF